MIMQIMMQNAFVFRSRNVSTQKRAVFGLETQI